MYPRKELLTFNYQWIGSSFVRIRCVQEPQESQVWSLDREDLLQEKMATYCSILAEIIPWTKESGGLESMGLQSRTWLSTHTRCAMGPFADILLGESPWTEGPGGLQSMGSQRVGQDWTTKRALVHTHAHMHTHAHTHINTYSFLFLPCFSLLFFLQLFVKPPETTTLPFCFSFSLRWFCLLPPV